jgi:hypothetical protein
MRIKAKNPRRTTAYYDEPYTVQHFVDWAWELIADIPRFFWFSFRYWTSKSFRIERAREYNRAFFGEIPTSQIYERHYSRDPARLYEALARQAEREQPREDDKFSDHGNVRQLRPEERTWPE